MRNRLISPALLTSSFCPSQVVPADGVAQRRQRSSERRPYAIAAFS